MNEPKLRGRVLSRVFNEMAIGTENERHDNFDPGEAPGDFSSGTQLSGRRRGRSAAMCTGRYPARPGVR